MSTESTPEPAVKPWSPPKRKASEVAAITLIIVACAALAIAVVIPGDSKPGQDRGIVEVTLHWCTILGFLVVPVLAICMVISAIRGLDKRGYASVGISRDESPAAFWTTFAVYIAFAVLAMLGIARLIYGFVSSINEV